MKQVLLYIFILLAPVFAQAQTELDAIVAAEQKAHRALSESRSGGATNNYNVIYHRLELNANPNYKYLSGKVTSWFIPDEAISEMEFDLTDSMTVDSILYHHIPVAFSRPGNDIIRVNFQVPLPAGAADSVTVFYQGVPDGSGFGSFAQNKHGADSVPIIWTLSEPYGARDWWPCKQTLVDKIDSLDVYITTPDTFRAASNGLLVEEIQEGSNKTYHWKHRYPVATYLVCFAVTNYTAYYDYVNYTSGDSLPILNYVYPESLQQAKEGTANVPAFIHVYDSLFGRYPFSREKYGHAQFGWGGGMEHQTMTFVSGFGFELLAHELAHHWFGDKVTCSSWADIWVNEGFADYLSGLCYEFVSPEWWIPYKADRIKRVTKEPGGSVYCTDTTSVGRIFDGRLTYGKGAMVLHTLRWVLGDSLFFAGLRNYLDDPANAYGYGNTEKLKANLSATSGRDLTAFFNQWVYGEGYPSYQLNWTQDFSKRVNLTIHQQPSHPSVSFFEVPVPVQFKNASSDTVIIFNPATSTESYSFKLPFMADTLVFDPELRILSANNSAIRDAAYDFSMLLYPNPVQDELQLRIESDVFRNADIKMFNAAGQQVYAGSTDLQHGSNVLKLNTGKLAAGVYRVTIKAGTQVVAKSFVKDR